MHVAIYGRSGCPFCVRAIQLAQRLEDAGSIGSFRYVDMPTEGMTKADLEPLTGAAVETVPQIFVGERHIGGFTEFARFAHDHDLMPATTLS